MELPTYAELAAMSLDERTAAIEAAQKARTPVPYEPPVGGSLDPTTSGVAGSAGGGPGYGPSGGWR